jgi:hypothetical protein
MLANRNLTDFDEMRRNLNDFNEMKRNLNDVDEIKYESKKKVVSRISLLCAHVKN